MEVKINKEIRNYTESVFFGLTMRQFVCAVCAVVVAVALFFLFHNSLGTEMVSWLCILGAAPFAVFGFVRYHGMPAEQFLWAWFRSEILEPRRLVCKPTTYYYEALKGNIAAHEKEMAVTAKKQRSKRKEKKNHA